MEYLKRYYKYILGGLVILIVLILVIYFNFRSINDKQVVEENILEEKTKEKKVEEPEEIVYYYVDVKGAVNNPGVYKLEEGNRIIDAINNAGGIRNNADTSIINLSKKIKDEMCIIVYTKSEIDKYKEKNLTINEINSELQKENIVIKDNFNDALVDIDEKVEESPGEEVSNSKISINTATKEELQTLSGIGESKAEAIIKYREENGEFSSIEDIKNVSGIGDSLYEKIKDNITT